MTTPYHALTPRLELRCYEPRDAQALIDAMADGTDHLLPWMAWAQEEPQPIEEKIALLRTFRGRFDLDQDWIFGAFERGRPDVLVGGTGLHPRVGPGAAEIGYWVRRGRQGAGIATEMASAMTRLGFECQTWSRIEIHCDARNVPSARIARKLGYREEGRLRGRSVAVGGGDQLVFGMLAGEYPASPAAALAVTAFDAVGGRILG